MKDTDVFEGKTLHDILKDVYDHTHSRRSRIASMLDSLSLHITNPDSAIVFAPIVRDYMDVLIKNDEHLIKLGTIAQRIISSEAYKGSGTIEELLTEAEKDSLLSEVNEVATIMNKIDTTVAAIPTGSANVPANS
jgi:hypothetical protein